MNPRNKWVRIAGTVICVLVAALMIFAGSGKAFGFAPKEVVEQMTKIGLIDQIRLIGFGEIIAAVLLIIPFTSPLGALAASGFWGGVICIHMAHHESIVLGCVFLALTWIGAFLRGSVPLVLASSARTPD